MRLFGNHGSDRFWWRSAFAFVSGALLVLALTPGVVAARNDPSPCDQFKGIKSLATTPDAIHAPGTFEWQYHTTWTNGDGTPGDDISDPMSISVAPGALTYRGNVMLRPYSVWGELPDLTVDHHVAAITPTQGTLFAVTTLFDVHDAAFAATTAVSVRWRVDGAAWSDWEAMAQGPAQSACAPGGFIEPGGQFVQAFGWMG